MKKQNKLIVIFTLIVFTSLLYGFSSDGMTRTATVRVFEGGEGLDWKSELNIVFEDGRNESIKLEGIKEKHRISNQKVITQALDKLTLNNYKLVSSSTAEIQGCMVTNYTFVK